MARYIAYGLTVESDIEPPGAVPSNASVFAAADIEIRFGPVDINPAAVAFGPYRHFGDRLLFTAPDVARYLCVAGETIIVLPEGGASEEAVKALLIATALPAALWMRGLFVLHAACLAMPGCSSAIAIAGPSGSGKSSALHQLVGRGAAVIADDSLAIIRNGDTPFAGGLPTAYFLARTSGEPRELVQTPIGRWRCSAPLAAIFVIDRTTDRPAAVFERVHGASALTQILRNRHRPNVPLALGQLERSLRDGAFLAKTVKVYVWCRRNGAASLTESEIAELVSAAEGKNMGEKVWSRSENWVGTPIEDDFVMINLDHGQYVSLNSTATDVWKAVESPGTIDRIVDSLIIIYDVDPDHCRKSVTTLLAKLEDMGLVSAH